MKTSDIVLHLMETVTALTDDFSDHFNPTAVSVSGTTVTVTKAAHGITGTETLISVTDAKIVNSVSNIDDSGTNVVFTTAEKHDLSLKFEIDQEENNSVRLASATDPSIDGEYTLVSVPDRETFAIASFPDTALTDVKVIETRDYSVNGLYTATYIDADNFSYELDSALQFDPDILVSEMKVHYSLRIRGASSIERVLSNYNHSAPGNLWGYVILDDVVPNKSIYSNTDSDYEQGGGNAWNIIMLSPFSFYAFIPELNTTDGMISRDKAEDIRPWLYSSLCGAEFDSGFTNEADSTTAPRGDSAYSANLKAFYIHQYEFVQNVQVAQSDTLYAGKTKALESIAFDYENIVNDNGKVIVSTIANLDTES